jgi:CRP-like cAMP-binding protein
MDVAPLAQVALFQGLNQSQLRKVAAICEEQQVDTGALIFREGERSTLWRIDRPKFDQLLFTDKELAYAVLWTLVRTLSGRLRETNEKMKAFFAMSKF